MLRGATALVSPSEVAGAANNMSRYSSSAVDCRLQTALSHSPSSPAASASSTTRCSSPPAGAGLRPSSLSSNQSHSSSSAGLLHQSSQAAAQQSSSSSSSHPSHYSHNSSQASPPSGSAGAAAAGGTSCGPPPRCCDTGRPIFTDPLTGQSICSCQYEILNYQRLAASGAALPGLSMYAPPYPESVAMAAAYFPALGPEQSPFYSSTAAAGLDLKENLAASGAGWPYSAVYHPYDAAFAGYPFNGYGMDLNGARRKNATRETTSTLKAWLNEHKKNPYPTKGEKIMLAIITKMTLTQVSTWFANARRRLKKENKMTWEPRNRVEDEDNNNEDNSDDRKSIDNNKDNLDSKDSGSGSSEDGDRPPVHHRLDMLDGGSSRHRNGPLDTGSEWSESRPGSEPDSPPPPELYDLHHHHHHNHHQRGPPQHHLHHPLFHHGGHHPAAVASLASQSRYESSSPASPNTLHHHNLHLYPHHLHHHHLHHQPSPSGLILDDSNSSGGGANNVASGGGGVGSAAAAAAGNSIMGGVGKPRIWSLADMATKGIPPGKPPPSSSSSSASSSRTLSRATPVPHPANYVRHHDFYRNLYGADLFETYRTLNAAAAVGNSAFPSVAAVVAAAAAASGAGGPSSISHPFAVGSTLTTVNGTSRSSASSVESSPSDCGPSLNLTTTTTTTSSSPPPPPSNRRSTDSTTSSNNNNNNGNKTDKIQRSSSS